MFFHSSEKRQVAALFLIIVFLCGGSSAARQKKDILQDVLSSDTLASSNVGIFAIDVSSGRELYSLNSGKLFIPASVLKILTAYTALKTLTPQYQFATEYYVTDTVMDSASVSTLYIKGNGDPALSTVDLIYHARTVARRLTTPLNGGIVVDNSYFDTTHFGNGWMWDDPNVPIAPFFVNDNRVLFMVSPGDSLGAVLKVSPEPFSSLMDISVQATTGGEDRISISSIAEKNREKIIIAGTLDSKSASMSFSSIVKQPELFAATIFTDFLSQNGVELSGPMRVGSVPPDARSLGVFRSRPLREIVTKFLKESNNLTGECILKTIGAVSEGTPGDASKGTEAVIKALQEIGVRRKEYRIVDGSGLSTYNLLSPEILVKVLKAAHDDFTLYSEFSSALPVSGTDGTLRSRMEDSLSRSVRAKTGTMSGVSSLAGYLKTRRGRLVAFAIIVNGFVGSSQPIRSAQDEMIKKMWSEW